MEPTELLNKVKSLAKEGMTQKQIATELGFKYERRSNSAEGGFFVGQPEFQFNGSYDVGLNHRASPQRTMPYEFFVTCRFSDSPCKAP